MKSLYHDLVILGGGPAGLTAGLYAARSRLDVVLLDRVTAQCTLVSASPAGRSGRDTSFAGEMSADGSRVVFTTPVARELVWEPASLPAGVYQVVMRGRQGRVATGTLIYLGH